MALTYSGRLKLALQTAHHARERTWPAEWGDDTYRNKIDRIRHRRKKTALLQPAEIDPVGREYTNALYDYALLLVKNQRRQEFGKTGPGWRKTPGDILRRATALQPEIKAYIQRNPATEIIDD